MIKQNEFRGKRGYDNKWIYGNLIIDSSGECHIVESGVVEKDGHHIRIDSDSPMFFDNETVGQFIGFSDKNSKKIYEGDKLRVHFSTWDGEAKSSEIIIKSIFDFETMIFISNSNEVEVIGNIYELEGKMKQEKEKTQERE